MNIPCICFKYSEIYDQQVSRLVRSYGIKRRDRVERWFAALGSKGYPSSIKILNYLNIVKPLWQEHGNWILRELATATSLRWKDKEIPCYVVGRCIPFSEPLTIPVFEKCPDYFMDILTHELIHQLFNQGNNGNRTGKAREYFDEKFKTESAITRIHIPIHALHAHVFLKLFDEARLRRELDLMRFFPNYKRSWSIVQRSGHEQIMHEFVKRIRD
jgi:hypothetical protein